jgi:hypothetical protein
LKVISDFCDFVTPAKAPPATRAIMTADPNSFFIAILLSGE